ncbi:MAG: 2-oxoacid:acceptor oxidoreductase family protein [Armatimonadetes bacterium]|nr:2-oxoacid:acceptor oxidoreductase family protein [Armatimonadota bacterium]
MRAILPEPVPTFEARPLSVRWHGRGGFGAKTAAMLLAELIIDAGAYGQAAPEFGPERRGAPVQAFTRIGPSPITRRGPIEEPDVLVVLDARLLETPTVTSGLRLNTWVVVNASGPVSVTVVPAARIITLDASGIARQTVGKDIPNIPMLAAVVALLDLVPRSWFLYWLRRRLAREFRGEIASANLQAAEAAMDEVTRGR